METTNWKLSAAVRVHSGGVSKGPHLTGLLQAWSEGDHDELATLAALVHQELRSLVEGLGMRASAGAPEDVAAFGDVVMVGHVSRQPLGEGLQHGELQTARA
jgi:hypothetical protein